jgi:hypothetical protein
MKNADTISKLSSIFYAYAGGKQFRKQFDKTYLNTLEFKDQKSYLEHLGYKLIGRSGRLVYLISSKKVLKLAPTFNDFSVRQNQLEYEVLAGKNSDFLPKVYDRAPDYRWIEVGLVRPLKSYAELSRLFGGVPFNDYTYILTYSALSLQDIVKMKIMDIDRLKKDIESLSGEDQAYRNELYEESEQEEIARFEAEIRKWENYLHNPVLVEMMDDIHTYGIPTRDLDRLDNLGVNTDGHLVFLDVGYRGV